MGFGEFRLIGKTILHYKIIENPEQSKLFTIKISKRHAELDSASAYLLDPEINSG